MQSLSSAKCRIKYETGNRRTALNFLGLSHNARDSWTWFLTLVPISCVIGVFSSPLPNYLVSTTCSSSASGSSSFLKCKQTAGGHRHKHLIPDFKSDWNRLLLRYLLMKKVSNNDMVTRVACCHDIFTSQSIRLDRTTFKWDRRKKEFLMATWFDLWHQMVARVAGSPRATTRPIYFSW